MSCYCHHLFMVSFPNMAPGSTPTGLQAHKGKKRPNVLSCYYLSLGKDPCSEGFCDRSSTVPPVPWITPPQALILYIVLNIVTVEKVTMTESHFLLVNTFFFSTYDQSQHHTAFKALELGHSLQLCILYSFLTKSIAGCFFYPLLALLRLDYFLVENLKP